MLDYLRRHHWGLIATFIALGGTAYASGLLPKNSVGTSQLQRNAVTLAKIGPRARAVLQSGATGSAGGDLTGRYPDPSVKPGSIGASKLAPLPAPTLANDLTHGCGPVGCIDWGDELNSPYSHAAYYRDNEGIVHLSGGAASHYAPGPTPTPLCGDPTLGVIFILPAGDRPATRETFAVDGGTGYARVDVTPTGQVVCMSAPYDTGMAREQVSLNGITFRAGG